jgi:hypothetical protein
LWREEKHIGCECFIEEQKRKYPNTHEKDHVSGGGSQYGGHCTLGSKGVCVPNRGLFFSGLDIRVSRQNKGREMVLRVAQKESEMAFPVAPNLFYRILVSLQCEVSKKTQTLLIPSTRTSPNELLAPVLP